MLQAVLNHLGIGVLPDYITEDFPHLVRVLDDVESAEVPVFLAYPEELRHSKRVAAFRDFVTDEIMTYRGASSPEAGLRPDCVMHATHGGNAAIAASPPLPDSHPAHKSCSEAMIEATLVVSYLPVGLGRASCPATFFPAARQSGRRALRRSRNARSAAEGARSIARS